MTTDFAAGYVDSDGHRTGTDLTLKSGRLSTSVLLGADPLVTDVAFSARDFGAAGFYGNYPAFEETRTTTATTRWRLRHGSTGSVDPVFFFRQNSDDFVLNRDNPALYQNHHKTNQVGGDVIGRTALASGSVAAGLHASREALTSSSLGDRSEWSAGASAEFAAGSVSGASVTAGLRGDRLSSGDFALSPSIAGAWNTESWLRFRASAGKAFRAPTWTERYYRDPSNIGNPDLTYESAWTFDGGVDLDLGEVSSSLTGWVRSAHDLIDWARPADDSSIPYETRNVENATFRGIEARVGLNDVAGFSVGVKGDWLNVTTSAVDGFVSKNALRPLTQNLSLSIDRRLRSFSGGFHLTQQRRTGESPYLLGDARLSFHARDFTLHVDGRNLGDELYRDITMNPAAGRSITIGLDWVRDIH
ncbi:MAG: TonB-dependent receptor [Gemmatimonadota bacterium]|nr:TonB-dependent receptor [Gemmatimonadota bacterium]